MMSGTKLVRRFFWVILMIIAVMFIAVYVYSVPMIQKEVYEIERNSARLALNNVFQLANKMYSNLESFRAQALDAHKQRLKAVVELTEAQIANTFAQAERDNLSAEQVRTRLFANLRNVTYGNDGYIWVADHDATLLSHPDPRFQGFEISKTDNRDQSHLIRQVIDAAVKEGEGFYQYKWQRLSEGPAIDKLSYVKNFPQWGFVIGSGLYLDDLEAEVQARKQAAIQEVREALSEIRVAKTGYLYIFDNKGHLLAHPNPNIDQTSALTLINPSSGRPIIEELIDIADTGKELHYKWDSPSDPGNYVYDKISLVRSMEGFGWYICSSVYVDELRHSSVQLSQRILTIALISILLAMGLAVFFIHRIVQPIKQLALTAERVRGGDLTARSGIQRDDELGMLAQTFDSMVHRLRTNIQTLDSKVQERTQELALLEERQRLILDALPAQIAYLDADLRYLFVNQGYADLFGGDKQSIVGRSIDAVIDPEMMDTIKPQIEQCLAGEEVAFEYSFNRDGQEMITKRILLPDINSNGEIIGLLNLSLDITAEKEAERRLTEAQRMNAAGQLAGGLAHDFNNLLSVIQGNLLAASDRFIETQGLQKYLTPAIRASRRGADITARLLAFSRRQALAPTAVDVKSLIEDTVELVTSSLPGNILVIQEIESDAALFVDPGQLENALVNLALNARDAMPEGGEIELRVRNLRVDRPLEYDEPVPRGDYVEIRVSDTGCGFPDEALAQACEPFFTTKGAGKGSGLGLSMVYGFIKQSRGFITIVNRPAGGACVSLLLPLTDVDLQPHHPQNVPAPTHQDFTNQLMLLVEDDRDVRAVVRDQLITLGFTVLEAGDADEAEQLIRSLPEIEGLVSDIDMPGRLNGFGLAELMREQNSNSTIVLISGNAVYQQPESTHQTWEILPKPFEGDTLAAAISAAKRPQSANR
ncbi:cache domain-containing protein [Pontibacterium granulatum]|uniref:cache domain-containing protein n=1 Tax=Pontibacterium granulatum TaxID=2036029 RepID=UPI00249B4172|nr:cache domain-containing protein [Pontibacterium granulatum]MDI3326591.1 cache domain-containing protein [Pontibacterium granulatum]